MIKNRRVQLLAGGCVVLLIALVATWGLWHSATSTATVHATPSPTPAPTVHYAANSVADLGATAPGSHKCAASNGSCTLRAAVEEGNQDVAAQRQTIVVIALAPGTYTLATALAISRGSVAITGADRATTIINAGGNDRAFDVASGATLSLRNLTITRGSATTQGGAIRAADSVITLDSVSVTDSTAGGDGGALYAALSKVSISNSTFDQDQGLSGGAIAVTESDLSITTTAVSNSSAASNGGAILVSNATALSIKNCTVKNDVAEQSGGGIFINGAAATATFSVNGSTFVGNTSDGGDGGGVGTDSLLSASGHAGLNVASSTFTGNRADGRGGAIAVPSKSLLTQSGNTYAQNDAITDPDASAP